MTTFDEARVSLSNTFVSGTSLCDPFLGLLPIDGVGVSFLGGRVGQSTICASNDAAARLDELQFDAGDGPCWQAMSTRRIVAAPDVRNSLEGAWPGFIETLRSDPINSEVGSMYAFPLVAGPLEIGAVDLYASKRAALTRPQLQNASALAQIASWQVLRRILVENNELDTPSPRPRREVHQATGMILAQLNIGPQDAELMLRAHAFAAGRSVVDVALDVIERRLDFSSEE
jgi:hypothetical protein